ncbi:hypothetical protein HGA64_04570, partial [Candidatus Falkowbacteria bacterium]|nr:hypothetical protein [Candidatus Falkowbacteria bacterium]
FFVAITAGIMIFISAFELIPGSIFQSRNRLANTSFLVAGAVSVVIIATLQMTY